MHGSRCGVDRVQREGAVVLPSEAKQRRRVAPHQAEVVGGGPQTTGLRALQPRGLEVGHEQSRCATSRKVPPGCNPRTNKLGRLFAPGTAAARAIRASQRPLGSGTAEFGNTSAGSSTSSSAAGGLSVTSGGFSKKSRARTGGP